MDLKLKNKIIVISEGTKSISENIIKVLATEGAIPVIIRRDEIDNADEKYFSVVADLTKPDDCEKAIQQILKKFDSIDGLINIGSANDSFHLRNTSYGDFVASLNENVVPYYLLTHYTLPALKKSKGVIVNIISNYAVATGGESALTREWAVELLKYNIRVNAVVENRAAATEEIANTVAFLLSEKSSHTTGQLIHCNNG